MPKSQLYLHARDQILTLTRRQKMLAGDRLPSETALSQSLGVSRNTVRDALMSLEQDGIVIRRHGSGTFMASPPHPLKTSLNQMLPIPELIAASGFKPQVRDLQIETLPAPPDVCETLKVVSHEPLVRVRLLYLADERPAVYITYWLVPSLRGDHVPWDHFNGHMLNFIESALHTRIHRTFVRIHAVNADTELAARLRVKKASPLLKLSHVAFTAEGAPVYCSTSYQDSNLLELSVVRQRK